MTFSSTAVISALVLTFAIASAQDAFLSNEIYQDMPKVQQAQIQALRDDVEEFGCEINVCFVLDGTLEISKKLFEDQKNFADLIVAITGTDDPVNYCAVHYNDFFTRISWRTQNRNVFLQRLHRAKQLKPQTGKVNVGRGFRFVVNQLLDRGLVANKVVLFSKGGRSLGRQALSISNYFRANKGGLCGVVVGKGDQKQLKAVAKGNVVNFNGFFELSEIIVSLVGGLCELPCGPLAKSC